ncbi:MAG: DUF2723 domain-containing protein [Anaerolineae bacterium]|nr:DUF2723 domain-containing protein [Anaerolineae bacterium]
MSLESAPARPLWGSVGASLSLLAIALVRRRSIALAPLGLAWAYVLWPAASPALALAIAVVAVFGTLIANTPRDSRRSALVDGAVFAAALALYVATLAPTVLPADSGEFQIVGAVLGVAHPPGYALYTMLARAFALLPIGDPAMRINLMGAVIGALTLLVVHQATRRLTGAAWPGIAAASALGLSTTFWAQSTTANIRGLTVLLTAACCAFAIRYLSAPQGPARVRALTGLAAAYGLAISHHASAAFFAPLYAAVVLWHDRSWVGRPARWLRYGIAFALPFLANLYIVARAISGAPFGTDELVSAGRVIDHLLGRGFSGDMFAYLRLDRTLWERFLVVGNIFSFQFGALLLGLAALGLGWMAWARHKQAVLLGGIAAIMAFVVATYRAPQSVEYLMPAYVPVAICAGCALVPIDRLRAPRTVRALLAAWALLPALALGLEHLPSYALLHHDRSARTYAAAVLRDAPPGAHILASWHWYTPLRYLQLVEGERRDILVSYVYPQGATEMPQAWPARIERELASADRPLIVTNYYPTYLDLPYRFEPLGEAYLVRAGPSGSVPAELTPVEARLTAQADRVRLLGFRLRSPAQVRPGDEIAVDLAWQPTVPLARGYAFTVQLVGADGAPQGQHDLRHDAAPSYTPGEVRVDRYRISVFPTAAPGPYALRASVYYTRDDGAWQRMTLPDGGDVVPLAAIEVHAAALPPVSAHAQRQGVRGGPVLVGVDYDDSVPGQRRVYLHWEGSAQPAVARLYAGERLIAQGVVPASARGGYLTTALDGPPEMRDLRLSLYGAEGQAPLRWIGPWGLPLRASIALPRAGAREHHLSFGGKLALSGLDYGSGGTEGGEVRVALRFVGLRPIVSDYVVSVRIAGGAQSDSVPALGAIPTYKWVRGSRISDVHLFPVTGGETGEVQVLLSVYDAFTGRALAPLDERIARLGLASVPLRAGDTP